MRLNSRATIITLFIAALILLALIGFLIYRLTWPTTVESPTSATLFVIDSSSRMQEPFLEGTTKLQTAQEVVADSVKLLPATEVIGVHVFGTGDGGSGCQDTTELVPAEQGNSSVVISEVNALQTVSDEAAMVQAGIEAVEGLGRSGFMGNAKLFFVIGGDPTCDGDPDLVFNTANNYAFDLQVSYIRLESVSDAGGGITISPGLNGPDGPIEQTPIDIDEVIETIAGNAPTLPTLDPVIPPPPATEIAGSGEEEEEEGSSGGGSDPETAEPTETIVEPTPSSTPTNTPVPTDTEVPPTSTPPSLETNTPTVDPNGTATNTPTPSETPDPVIPTETPTATNTQIPPTDTPIPTATQAPATPGPTSTIPNEPESIIAITNLNVIINESNASAVVILRRDNVNSKSVLVNYDTVNGSATAGSDFIQANGQITWAANEGGEKQITINIVNDQAFESNETFQVSLSNAVNATLQNNLATITIQDNESGAIIINPTSINVSESAGTTSAAISLNGAPQSPVTIGLSSSDTNVCIPPSSITLDGGNWDSGVPISITIVDNPGINPNGSASCTIQTAVSTSADASFNGIDPSDISIQVLDNDALYVDGTCADSDGNQICDDGIRFKTIQAAIDNGISNTSELNIIVTSSPHTESGIQVTRNISLSGLSTTILQAAGAPRTASDRIMTINLGVAATLNNLSLENGNIVSSNGGAILNNGTLTINDVTLKNNHAGGSGGAIAVSATGILTENDGGIYDTNSSGSCGGALFIALGGAASISRTNFARNSAVDGAAVCANGNVTINFVNISGNVASGNGGALFVNSGGSVEPIIENSTVENNQANNGGGIYIAGGSKARTSGSTYSFNVAAGGAGGGIYTEGDLTTWNVTISTNRSDSGSAGIDHRGGVTNIYNTTIAFNTSFSGAASGMASTNGATLLNSIVDGNTNGDCIGNFNLFHALIGFVTPSCTTTELSGSVSQLNQSAGLGSLGDNGGGTLTHMPASGGSAIDTGWTVGNGCDGADQRGVARPQGASCDIGAVER